MKKNIFAADLPLLCANERRGIQGNQQENLEAPLPNHRRNNFHSTNAPITHIALFRKTLDNLDRGDLFQTVNNACQTDQIRGSKVLLNNNHHLGGFFVFSIFASVDGLVQTVD